MASSHPTAPCPSESQLGAISGRREKAPRHRIARVAWGAAGLASFALGALGAVLPLLPTTPLILLAAFCLARSSKRLEEWLHSTKLYRTIIESYIDRRAMTVSAKLKILIPVTIILAASFVLLEEILIGRVIVAAVLLAHFVFFGFFVKTAREKA